MAWSASRGESTEWSPRGVPGRGSSRLIGTSQGSRSASSNAKSMRCSASHPCRGCRRSTAPSRRRSRGARWRPGRRRSGWCRSEGTARGRPRGCGCSASRRRRRGAPPGRVEEAERARDLQAGLVLHRLDGVDHLGEQPLLRTAHGHDDAELGGAGVAGRAAASRTSSRSRNGYTSASVWYRADCEQNAQSSGQAPDLALIRLSSSTSGPQ